MAENTENYRINLNSIIKNDVKNSNELQVDLEAECSVILLGNLKSQFDQNILCDLYLVATDGTKISVHQNILMASSCYFNAMLLSGMAESETKEIPLKDVNGEILRLLIDFCYSGKVKITADNIENLLAAASRYEFVKIEKECSKFLEQCLKNNALNCLSYYSLAYMYDFDGLKELCKQFLCENVMKLKDTEEFLSLEFDQLFDVIKSDDLNVSREEDAFNAVMKWINYDKTNREKFMLDFYKVLRLVQMQASFIVTELLDATRIPEIKQIFKDVLLYKIGQLELKPVSLEGYSLNPRKSTVLVQDSSFNFFS